MESEQAREYVRANHRAVLATRGSDGAVQMSPVVAGVDGAGNIIISTREPAYKTRNIRRDPHVSLCVFTDAFYGAWVQIDGTARVLSLPEALEPLVDYYRRVVGEHPDWDDYRRAMVQERRVLLQISIERAGPDRRG
jgi:PPOX class probable F420-dependent enzyme